MDAMKDRPRITNQMDKVCISYLLLHASFFIICFVGKFFWDDEERYECEWKDGKQHGQGKKVVICFKIDWF